MLYFSTLATNLVEKSLTTHAPVSVQEEQNTHNISYESRTGCYPRQNERNTI